MDRKEMARVMGQLYRDGVSVDAIAVQFNTHPNQVYKFLQTREATQKPSAPKVEEKPKAIPVKKAKVKAKPKAKPKAKVVAKKEEKKEDSEKE